MTVSVIIENVAMMNQKKKTKKNVEKTEATH